MHTQAHTHTTHTHVMHALCMGYRITGRKEVIQIFTVSLIPRPSLLGFHWTLHAQKNGLEICHLHNMVSEATRSDLRGHKFPEEHTLGSPSFGMLPPSERKQACINPLFSVTPSEHSGRCRGVLLHYRTWNTRVILKPCPLLIILERTSCPTCQSLHFWSNFLLRRATEAVFLAL